jgi:hypothetical protein
MAGEKVRYERPVEADHQPYVTDLDFKYASLPPEITRFLSEVMPAVDSVDGHADGSANAYDCMSFICCIIFRLIGCSQRILGNDLWTIIDLDSCMNDKSATKQDIPLCCTVQGQHRRHHPLSLSYLHPPTHTSHYSTYIAKMVSET